MSRNDTVDIADYFRAGDAAALSRLVRYIHALRQHRSTNPTIQLGGRLAADVASVITDVVVPQLAAAERQGQLRR